MNPTRRLPLAFGCRLLVLATVLACVQAQAQPLRLVQAATTAAQPVQARTTPAYTSIAIMQPANEATVA